MTDINPNLNATPNSTPNTNPNTNQDIYTAKLHWIIFLGPLILMIMGMLLGIYVEPLQVVSLFFVGFAIAWAAMNAVNYLSSSLTIRSKQVILRTGVVVKKITDIPMNKIESIDIRQSILGSILRYGTLMITGTGGTQHFINFLDKPLTCRRYIEQLMHE